MQDSYSSHQSRENLKVKTNNFINANEAAKGVPAHQLPRLA